MAEQIQFNDGAAYERMTGTWSRLAGDVFLDWLALPVGLRWIDIGCGNGAFTEALVERCAPAEVHGIDPSKAQLDFARARPGARLAQFQQGDAMALPFPENRFDAAVMALAIFFVPEPEKGVAEMARVVRPGGAVATYAWDMSAAGGGFPWSPIQDELVAFGKTPISPPQPEASSMQGLRDLWTNAGFEAVETREIVVRRSFADFEDFWMTTLLSGPIRQIVNTMPAGDVEQIKARVRAKLPPDAAGRISYESLANAIKGRVPK